MPCLPAAAKRYTAAPIRVKFLPMKPLLALPGLLLFGTTGAIAQQLPDFCRDDSDGRTGLRGPGPCPAARGIHGIPALLNALALRASTRGSLNGNPCMKARLENLGSISSTAVTASAAFCISPLSA